MKECNFNNEFIKDILNISIETLENNNNISLNNVYVILSKALEGVKTKKDLSFSETETIKNIKELIKGL